MELFLVRDVPAWLVGVVLVVGLPLAMVGLDLLVHRFLPHERLTRHNDVTGVIVALVGVAYALIIGQCVVSLWEGFKDAKDTVRAEAANLVGLVPTSRTFGDATQRQVTEAIIRYHEDLVDEWDKWERGAPGERSATDLAALVTVVDSLRPDTAGQEAFVKEAFVRIGQARELRQRSLAEAEEQQMSAVMWIGVLGSTAAVLCLCLLLGIDDRGVRRVLLVLCSAVIASNLFLIMQMNYPYYGSFAVTPETYEQVIADLRSGL